MFDESAMDPPGAVEAFWEHIHDLYLMVERCHNHYKDENAWLEVVRAMLKIASRGGTKPCWKLTACKLVPVVADIAQEDLTTNRGWRLESGGVWNRG
jgi:hypothetical protein